MFPVMGAVEIREGRIVAWPDCLRVGADGTAPAAGRLTPQNLLSSRFGHGVLPTRRSEPMKVWIDQDLCTGDGLCEEIAPAVFTLLDDGLAYVKESDQVRSDPGGAAGMALVPDDLEDAVTEAAEECPGECIFIEQG